jgi:N-acetylmuramoyl-L-alanine amidase
LSTQEVVTLASLVQRETIFQSDMPPAAGVFLARLRAGMTLGSQPTITYAIDSAKGVGGDASLYWRRRLSPADVRSSSPYNTYNHKGLPPGPIASPSIDAIEAVLFPARVPYRYFVAEPDGALAYARSFREHRANVRRYLSRVANRAVPKGPELQHVLDSLAVAFPAHVGLVVKNLSTGEHAAVNARDFFTSSSLYELLVMAAGYDEIRQGHMRVTDRVPIPPGAAALDPARTQSELGRAPTVTQAIREMITRSSNAAAFALVHKIGARKIERFGRTLGLRDTWLTASRLLTTPADVARLLEAIAEGRVVTRAASARMRALLGAQRLDNGLASSLPRGTHLEHMIGDFQTAHHDAGVFYTRHARILVVAMTEGMSTRVAASRAIALIGEVALNYFAPRAKTVVAGKSVACSHGAFRPRASGPLSRRTIVLDPGHGGIDGGAVYSPAHGVLLTEKQFNLKIALRLTELLTRNGATVYLTRCRDAFLSLPARAAVANSVGADLLVSIHLNAEPGSASDDGTTILYLSDRDRLAANYMLGSFDVPALWDVLNARLPLQNRGLQQRPLTIFLYSRCPTILTEAVYLRNPREAAALQRGSRVDEIARGHLRGILNYFSRAQPGSAANG